MLLWTRQLRAVACSDNLGNGQRKNPAKEQQIPSSMYASAGRRKVFPIGTTLQIRAAPASLPLRTKRIHVAYKEQACRHLLVHLLPCNVSRSSIELRGGPIGRAYCDEKLLLTINRCEQAFSREARGVNPMPQTPYPHPLRFKTHSHRRSAFITIAADPYGRTTWGNVGRSEAIVYQE
jgi:hypothetical protein